MELIVQLPPPVSRERICLQDLFQRSPIVAIEFTNPGEFGDRDRCGVAVKDFYDPSLLHNTLPNHPKVDPRPPALQEPILDLIVVEADAQHSARQARLGGFEFDRADPEPIADVDRVLEQTLDREVLAESAEGEHETRHLGTPELVVLDRVGVDGLVDPTMELPVGLAVEDDADDITAVSGKTEISSEFKIVQLN